MITASIVTYKTDQSELETILDCAIYSSIEIIYLIDNSPLDYSLERYSGYSPKISYIPNPANPGFGAAHNIALKIAIQEGAKYHIVLNPDIIFESGCIEKLTEYLDENEDVGLVMPKVVYPNGELQYLCKLLPTPLDWIGRRFLPFKTYIDERNYTFEMRASKYNSIMTVPYLSGCFMMFRVKVLEELGLFDEGIFMYGEDTDISRRIYQKYRTVFNPELTIIHKHKKESHKNKRLLWIHMKAAIYYFNKWGWFFDKERRAINKKVKKLYLGKNG